MGCSFVRDAFCASKVRRHHKELRLHLDRVGLARHEREDLALNVEVGPGGDVVAHRSTTFRR
eukprot:3708433-Prorocentrum_lima.AAC.1